METHPDAAEWSGLAGMQMVSAGEDAATQLRSPHARLLRLKVCTGTAWNSFYIPMPETEVPPKLYCNIDCCSGFATYAHRTQQSRV